LQSPERNRVGPTEGLVIVSGGEVADAVFDPVPVTVIMHAAPADEGGVNNALHVLPPPVAKLDTVDAPEQPPPHVALVRPEGAATV
jgi:hypothetical protein